jgi:predicted DNA-binding protein
MTTVRLPLRVEEALNMYCLNTRRSKSEVIIDSLERFFSEENAGKEVQTPYELAVSAGFIGTLELDENAACESRARIRAKLVEKHNRPFGQFVAIRSNS